MSPIDVSGIEGLPNLGFSDADAQRVLAKFQTLSPEQVQKVRDELREIADSAETAKMLIQHAGTIVGLAKMFVA